MINTLALNGANTMLSDLHEILKTGDCLAVRNEAKTEGKAERTYIYKYAWIHVPTTHFEEKEFTFKLNDERLEEIPASFWQLIRTANAVWDENMEKEIINHQENYNEETRRKYRKQSYMKKILHKIFEKENWVIPYYIYWYVDFGGANAVHAVLPNGEGELLSVSVTGHLRNEIEELFHEDWIDTNKLYQHNVKMKNTSAFG